MSYNAMQRTFDLTITALTLQLLHFTVYCSNLMQSSPVHDETEWNVNSLSFL